MPAIEPIGTSDGFDKPYQPKPNGAGPITEGDNGPESSDQKPEDTTDRDGSVQSADPFTLTPTDEPIIIRSEPDPGESAGGITGEQSADNSGSTNSGPRRRGRPLGSKNQAKPATSDLESSIESLLFSLHAMGAAFITEELELSEDEANKLGKAIRKVARQYTYVVDPKKLAIAELVSVCAIIYGPRAATIYKRATENKTLKEPKPVQPSPQKVQPINEPKPQQQQPVGTGTQIQPLQIHPALEAHMGAGVRDGGDF